MYKRGVGSNLWCLRAWQEKNPGDYTVFLGPKKITVLERLTIGAEIVCCLVTLLNVVKILTGTIGRRALGRVLGTTKGVSGDARQLVGLMETGCRRTYVIRSDMRGAGTFIRGCVCRCEKFLFKVRA